MTEQKKKVEKMKNLIILLEKKINEKNKIFYTSPADNDNVLLRLK